MRWTGALCADEIEIKTKKSKIKEIMDEGSISSPQH